MSIDAVIVAGSERDGFRIVRQTEKDKVTYVLEMPDGFDALGCERWKDIATNGKVVQVMRDWIIRHSLKEELGHEQK